MKHLCYLKKLTVRYGNEVTWRPPILIWYPSTPARNVRTNILPSTKGNGQVISGFCSRPINRLNQDVVLDSLESIMSFRIHFSHRLYPSTAKYNNKNYKDRNRQMLGITRLTINNWNIILTIK